MIKLLHELTLPTSPPGVYLDTHLRRDGRGKQRRPQATNKVSPVVQWNASPSNPPMPFLISSFLRKLQSNFREDPRSRRRFSFHQCDIFAKVLQRVNPYPFPSFGKNKTGENKKEQAISASQGRGEGFPDNIYDVVGSQ